jgi:hypothetical protein
MTAKQAADAATADRVSSTAPPQDCLDELERANPMFGGASDQVLVEHDAELVAAITAWKQRRLAEIDEQLRELGIDDIEALVVAFEKVDEDCQTRKMAEIQAAMSSNPFMLILPEREA